MTKSRYKPHPDDKKVPIDTLRTLPTDRPVAVYYRQSTLEQVGNISTVVQTVDMTKHLMRLGWARSDIILIDMDAGVSGTKKIDERPGMRELFDLIEHGEIGAVACEDEDRLFRDVTQIQVNIFIEACKSAHVMVITPSITYDFADPVLGDFHARQSRFKSEIAADYIKSFVRGKLHRAKQHLARNGRWFGGRVPPGYMIDIRKTLDDGQPNQHWRKYVPFKPYAEVVLAYFEMFVSKAGNLHDTLRQIYENGPFYPDRNICLPPPGFRRIYPFHPYPNGYCPGRQALQHLLTNAVYIGHWVMNDAVVIYDNHPAIVPDDLFFRAFNYLSPVTLKGEPNQNYRPFRDLARPTLEEHRTEERPLCSGMIVWEYGGKPLTLSTIWISQHEYYVYAAQTGEPIDRYKWSKKASEIDQAVVELVRQKLVATFDEDVWAATLADFTDAFEKERVHITARITQLERVMDNLAVGLGQLSNPAMIQRAEKQFSEAQTEYERLKANLEDNDAEAKSYQAVVQLRKEYLPALNHWDDLERNEKRAVLHAFIEQIEATPFDRSGLMLQIKWRDQTTDEVMLIRQSGAARDWLMSEVQELLDLLDNDASQVEIAAAFPDRTWEAIRHRIWEVRGGGAVDHIDPKPIHDRETYTDYVERISGDTVRKAGSGDRWNSEDAQRLLDLFDAGATQVQIAEAFPTRRWWRIRAKLTKMRGTGLKIPAVGTIQRNETIHDYWKRTGQSSGGEEVDEDVDDDGSTVTVRSTTNLPDCPDGSRARERLRCIGFRGPLRRGGRGGGEPGHRWPVHSRLPQRPPARRLRSLRRACEPRPPHRRAVPAAGTAGG